MSQSDWKMSAVLSLLNRWAFECVLRVSGSSARSTKVLPFHLDETRWALRWVTNTTASAPVRIRFVDGVVDLRERWGLAFSFRYKLLALSISMRRNCSSSEKCRSIEFFLSPSDGFTSSDDWRPVRPTKSSYSSTDCLTRTLRWLICSL